jgi:hypothetical protein
VGTASVVTSVVIVSVVVTSDVIASSTHVDCAVCELLLDASNSQLSSMLKRSDVSLEMFLLRSGRDEEDKNLLRVLCRTSKFSLSAL